MSPSPGVIHINKQTRVGYSADNVDRSDLTLKQLLVECLDDNRPENVDAAMRRAMTSKERSRRAYKERFQRKRALYPDYYFIEDIVELAGVSDSGARYRLERHGDTLEARQVPCINGMTWILPKDSLPEFIALGTPKGRPSAPSTRYKGTACA